MLKIINLVVFVAKKDKMCFKAPLYTTNLFVKEDLYFAI